MARKIRSDIKIGNLEKKLGLDKGAIRNPDGTDARSDKKLGTLRQEYERHFAGPPVRKSSSITKIENSNSAKKVTNKGSLTKGKNVTVKKTSTKKKINLR